MVCLVLRIANPDWPLIVQGAGWILVNALFAIPGLILMFPLTLLTFSGVTIHDYPFWMLETFAWAFWALSIYVTMGFYYRAPSQGQSRRFVSSVISGFGSTILVGAGWVLGISVLGYVSIAWYLFTWDCVQWNTDAFFITARAETVTDCLDAGFDLNARNNIDETPLHHAAQFNASPAVIGILLDAGADLNARTEDGWTPLHVAARYNGNPVVIAMLLGAGADPNARTGDGGTPWDFAQENDALEGTDALQLLNDARFQ